MTRHSRVTLMVAALLIASSCRGGGQAAKVYDGVGVVVSVDRTTGTVQINHEDIKGFMTAMTMTFKAKRTSLLDKIEPGDKVDFKLRDSGFGVVLIKIDKRQG
jgi:Cu/Ag efflux protein CusF